MDQARKDVNPMCEMCRASERARRVHEEEDRKRFIEAEEPLPPRKSRKGHSRAKWCKGKVGVPHRWELQPIHNGPYGRYWWLVQADICQGCGKKGWMDWGMANDTWRAPSERTKTTPVVCRVCGAHVAKVHTREKDWRGKEYSSWAPPGACPKCGLKGPRR